MVPPRERPLIVIYGSDPVLLCTRQWVLERADFEVALAETAGEVDAILQSRTVTLLILCHTLTFEACRTALSTVESASAQTQRLLLDPSLSTTLGRGSHESFDPFEGPLALIRMAKKMTGSQARSSEAPV